MAIGVGIELGPATVRGVVLERSGKQAKLLASHKLSCETAVAESLTRSLAQLKRVLRITKPMVLGIPSSSSMLVSVNPLVANTSRAALAVQFELQQHLPFDLADAVWHYAWLTSTNGRSGGTRMRQDRRAGIRNREPATPQPAPRPPHSGGAVVGAMRRALLEERLACCRRAGLAIQAVAMNAMATLTAWHAQYGGARAGSLMTAHGGAGPEGVTLLNLTHHDQLMEWIVWAPTGIQVVPVMSGSPEMVWQDLAASWEAFQGPAEALPPRVWVVGETSQTPELESVLSERLRLRVEWFDATKLVIPGGARWDHPEGFVTAIGLALQGLGMARWPLNLLQRMQTEEQGRHVRRLAAMTSGLCAIAMTGFGLNGMLEIRQRRLRVLQTLERQERLYQTLRPDLRTVIQRQQWTQQRSLALARLTDDATRVAACFAHVVEALPDPVWLTTMECASAENGLAGLLEGRAKSFQDVTQFLDRLKTVAGMTTVKPLSTNVTTDETTGKETVAFSIQLQRAPAPPTPLEEADKASGVETPKERPKNRTRSTPKR